MKKILLRVPATCANVGPGYDIFAMSLSEPWDDFEISINESKKINIEIINNLEKIPVDIMEIMPVWQFQSFKNKKKFKPV